MVDKFSRLIFHDLTPELARLRGETGTAFIPHSVRIGLAGVYGAPHPAPRPPRPPPLASPNFSRFGNPNLRPRPPIPTRPTCPHVPRTGFRDEPYIEAIHFSNKSCPFIADQRLASFTNTDNSRSEVSFSVDPTLPECALPTPGKATTFLNLNEQCARSVVAGEQVIGLQFEPRCMVVTLATESRRDLFDQLLAAGRMLDDPLRVHYSNPDCTSTRQNASSFNHNCVLCVVFRRVLVNYTVALETEPDVFAASTNCQNSMVMHTNYLLDKTLQNAFTELETVRADIAKFNAELEFADFVAKNRRYYMPPSQPPPPPPSPPPPATPGASLAVAPPNPPTLVTYDVYVQQLTHEISVLEGRERSLLVEIQGCEHSSGSRTRVCGLSATEAPNPWISADGTPCRGNATLSARAGDFCGYWDSKYNVDAAPADEKTELLQAGTWCYADDLGDVILECDGRAQRTQRAGVHELEVRGLWSVACGLFCIRIFVTRAHTITRTFDSRSRQFWMREDRRYCESPFFRSRIVPDDPTKFSAELCRKTIAKRNETCFLECDVCNAYCTSSTARAIKDTITCSIELPTLGITAAARSSDAGERISYGHGAIRPQSRVATPDNAFLEQFDILINNDVERPLVNRDAVSCRKPHRESTTGGYVPGLDANGNPKKRLGFMVPCDTDSDCYSRCGEHPITGQSFVCTPNPQFYSFHVINESLTAETLAIELSAQDLAPGIPVTDDYDSFESRLAILEARPTWITKPDTHTTQAYYVDEPGEDKFDPPRGSYGVCTDARMDFMHTNCESRGGAAATIGIKGCTSRLGYNLAYCGARVERFGPDFNDVSISSESLEWPRVLAEGGVFNGVVEQRVTCADQVDCMTKCERFARTARDGGLPIPPGCVLCDSICPTNIVTTVMDGIQALQVDVGNAYRLISQCFAGGLAGCVCNVILALKPAWVDLLPTPQERCEGGQIFGLLANKILELTLQSVEDSINGYLIKPANLILSQLMKAVSFGAAGDGDVIPKLCLTGFWKPSGRCFEGDESMFAHLGCYATDRARADQQCYFFRCVGVFSNAILGRSIRTLSLTHTHKLTNSQTHAPCFVLLAANEPSAGWKVATTATNDTKTSSTRPQGRS